MQFVFMPDNNIRKFYKNLSKKVMIGSMNNKTNLPKIISTVAIALGSLDLIRGFMHTILIRFAATSIAGLDLSTFQAGDLLVLMGSFGISNYISGLALILMGWKSRELAWIMMGVIPAAYLVGGLAIRFYSADLSNTQAAWGGKPMMMVYMVVCILTFMYGLWKKRT
jgi:hypothetical protein